VRINKDPKTINRRDAMITSRKFNVYVSLFAAIIMLGIYGGSLQAAEKTKPDIVTMLL
jgi:hypothetical protein